MFAFGVAFRLKEASVDWIGIVTVWFRAVFHTIPYAVIPVGF